MNKPLLSVVVPVYNKENYLRESLYSLINQTFKDTEIICINDGSSDNSLDVLYEIQAQCERIKIITQENKGASAARNEGIRNANGKYLMVMDADDTIEANMHEIMVSKAEEFCADMVVCNFAVRSKNRDEITKLEYANNVLFARDYIEEKIIPNSICANNLNKALFVHTTILFKRDILIDNNVKYDEEFKKEEDKPVIMEYLKYAQSIVFVEEVLYNYIKREHSLISCYSDRFNNILSNMNKYKRWFSDIYDFNENNWQKYYIKNFEESIQYVLAHRKDVHDLKKEIMKIITHPDSEKAFELSKDINDFVKEKYANKEYEAIYKYYMKKFLKFRIKIFVRSFIKK